MRLEFTSAIFLVFAIFSSCSKDKADSSKGVDEPVSAHGGGEAPASKEDSHSHSIDLKTFVNSYSNNPFTSKTINRAAAASQAEKLSATIKDGNTPTLFAFVSASRLAGRSLSDAVSASRIIVDQTVRRGGVGRELSDSVRLELAIHALYGGKLAFAETMLEFVLKAKDPRLRAAAHNLIGVIALRQDRIPEAVFAFKEALKEENSFVAARLNLGFLALYGGDFGLARKMLGDMQEDWFVQSGLLIIDRMTGDVSKADAHCANVLKSKPNHKPTLYNCALHAFQGKQNYKEARDLLNRMLKIQGGLVSWDNKAGFALGQVDMEEAKAEAGKHSPAPAPQAPK